MIIVCRRCGREGPSAEAVRLWDRCVYCRACVDEASPGLFDYAREHDALEEQVEGVARQSLRRSLIVWLVVTCVPIPLIVWGAWRIAFAHDPWGYLIGVAGIAAATGRRALLRRLSPDAATLRIAAKEGSIECTHGGRQLLRAPLANWSWSYLTGDPSREAAPMDPLLVLSVSGLGSTQDTDERFACGYTDETRSRWLGFLKLAGVPERHREGPVTGDDSERDRGPGTGDRERKTAPD